METSRITLRQEDKTTTTIYANLSDVSTPIGSVLLLHDMAEHHGRFDDFIKILNQKGYDTYSYDHRGHGSEIRYEELGFIAEENGHELLITDAIHIIKYIKKNNRGRKLILFGHGMGALIARCVIQAFDSLDACILCSSPNPPHKDINSQLTAAKFIRFTKKPWHRSVYLSKKLTEFKSFSKFSNRTAYDWISRDNQLVGAYMSDPLCGFLGTVAFYIDVLNLMDEAVSRTNLKQIRNDLPILLLGGSNDPVCGYGEDITDLFDIFQHYKFTEVDCTIYEEARHDLLHETNSAEIIKDILEWLNRALDNRRLKAAAALRAQNKKKKKSKNRTAAEAARSALGYANKTEEDLINDSITAEDVGDDDDFLDDMGYFNGRSDNQQEPEEEDEDFIIMNDDDKFDEFEEDEEAPEQKDEKEKPKKASSEKKSGKDTSKKGNEKDSKTKSDSKKKQKK